MELLDPATGQPLPNDAIQRVLFVANSVHVYTIPPLASTKGHSAASWTADPKRHIFTARVRVIETAVPGADLKVDVVLEDPASAQLFAAAPYTAAAAVEPVTDSSRFFALTVRDPQGRRAFIGIGFEERSEAFDLSIALQEGRKSLGWDTGAAPGSGRPQQERDAAAEEKRDYSLKEGETITISFGGSKFGRRRPQQQQQNDSSSATDLQAFALPPPPPPAGPSGAKSSGGFSLPPPPPPAGAQGAKSQKHDAKDFGFDDGQFGEFA